MVNGKEHAFVGSTGGNGIGTSIGTFFTDFLMTSADMPAWCTEVGGTAAAAFGITRVITALVLTLSFKIIPGDASNGPATRTSCNKWVVIDGEKTISLPIGAPGFWLRGNAAAILAVVVGKARGAIWIDINEWVP